MPSCSSSSFFLALDGSESATRDGARRSADCFGEVTGLIAASGARVWEEAPFRKGERFGWCRSRQVMMIGWLDEEVSC